MDETNISELYDKLKKETGDNPQYQQFLESLRKANEKIDALHKTRKGAPPLVTAEDKKELTALFRSIGTTAEKAILAEGDQNVQDVMRSISGYASANYKMLQRYDPETGPKTLPTLMEDARTVTLDTRGAQLKSALGGNLSSRQPLTFVNSRGKVVSGVFTPKTVQYCWEDTRRQLKSIAPLAATAEGQRMIEGFLDAAAGRLLENPSEDTALNLNNIGKQCRDNEERKITEKKLNEVLKTVYKSELEGKDPQKLIGNAALTRMAKTVNTGYMTANLSCRTAGILDGSRIDSRNSAMSSVADLLGMSDVIARSRPMKIVIKDDAHPEGKVVEGTFMEECKGIDVNNLPQSAAKYGEQALEGTDGRAFRQMADLQVLDYICGNVDRHGGNIFYQFDENNKFCGIQGLDNDAAFGRMVIEGGGSHHLMAGPKSMKAVSRSTYDRVQKLKPEELRFILRGHDLNEAEILAATKRLKNLQNELKLRHEAVEREPDRAREPGAIRVIEDDQWKNFGTKEIRELEASNKGNLFSRANGWVRLMPEKASWQKADFRKLAADVAIGERNRAVDGGLERETEKCDKLLTEMERVTNRGFFHIHKGSSDEFEDVRQAVQAYKELQQEIQLRIDNANSHQHKNDLAYASESAVTTRDLVKLAACSRQIKETAMAYLDKKGPEEKISNSYTRSRVQAVKLALEFGEKGAARSPEEMESARRNERLADERFARGIDAKEQEIKNAQADDGPEPGA